MSKNFDELVMVMARLRAPGGCPWDREQTYESLAQYLLEEAFETFDAIQDAAEGKPENLREELGDLLLQIIFHSQIAEEKDDFNIEDVCASITRKMILRHPHVFGDKKLDTANDVLQNWDELKKAEREITKKEEKTKNSILDEVPLAFPALIEAGKLTKKAAKVNFDWENSEQIFDKLAEEVDELKQAISANLVENIEEEIGDLLFVIVNLARKLDVEPETALKKTNRKFRRRFKFVESKLKERGQSLEESNLEEMDVLWNESKKKDLTNKNFKNQSSD
ncbi:MAG: nucleoside triphosphate pyrophosphohydrolase [Acidobacteria bacterium]|nr:nucleoside triphosphate pyrophosphohydrolase [Acidobacteriota bacterium]MCA1638117.1 nucleoside triphosphate pyrophosphohydrolase [Acidobacteriota bacterium]